MLLLDYLYFLNFSLVPLQFQSVNELLSKRSPYYLPTTVDSNKIPKVSNLPSIKPACCHDYCLLITQLIALLSKLPLKLSQWNVLAR